MQNQHLHSTDLNSKPASLDSVFKAMEYWRKNKSKYGASIPDEIWLQLFQLEKAYPLSKIKQIFGISKKTYLNKRAELQGKINPYQSQPVHDVPTGFSEAIVSDTPPQFPGPDETPQLTRTDKKSLRKKDRDDDSNPATFLDFSTVVVEFIRADGQRMKIHTTDKSFRELMRVFFEEGGTAL